MLSRVAVILNNIEDVLEADELWPWLQKTFTLATAYSLYGERDPFSADSCLFRTMWYVNPIPSNLETFNSVSSVTFASPQIPDIVGLAPRFRLMKAVYRSKLPILKHQQLCSPQSVSRGRTRSWKHNNKPFETQRVNLTPSSPAVR